MANTDFDDEMLPEKEFNTDSQDTIFLLQNGLQTLIPPSRNNPCWQLDNSKIIKQMNTGINYGSQNFAIADNNSKITQTVINNIANDVSTFVEIYNNLEKSEQTKILQLFTKNLNINQVQYLFEFAKELYDRKEIFDEDDNTKAPSSDLLFLIMLILLLSIMFIIIL